MILTLLAGTAFALQAASQAAVRIPNLAPPPAGTQVLARVGKVEIHADDIAAILWEARGEEVLNDYVAYHLLKAEADKQGVIVSDADVTRKMASLLKDQAAELPAGTDPQTTLDEQGLTASRLFLNVKTDLLLDGLVALAFRPADYVKISTILIVPKTQDPADIADATNRMNKAAARIKAGETWEKVASDTIEDETAKKTGGLVGWRPLDLFPAALRTEIASLPMGGISSVAKTNSGVQMFRVEMQGKDARGETIDEIKAVANPVLREKTLQNVRTNAKVERIPYGNPKG